MMIPAGQDAFIESSILVNYFYTLIGLFFKILPLRESNEPTLGKYIKSLQRELLGCKNLISFLEYDGRFLELISTLQYFLDHPDAEIEIVRSDVFRSIEILKKLSAYYTSRFESPGETWDEFESELQRVNKLKNRGGSCEQRMA